MERKSPQRLNNFFPFPTLTPLLSVIFSGVFVSSLWTGAFSESSNVLYLLSAHVQTILNLVSLILSPPCLKEAVPPQFSLLILSVLVDFSLQI